MSASRQLPNDPRNLAHSLERALIFPGCISHTRLFPNFHSFTYSYLLVGLPIKPLAKGNSIISVDTYGWRERGWLCVNSEDHLQREDDEGGIRWKLDRYLLLQVCRTLNGRPWEGATDGSWWHALDEW